MEEIKVTLTSLNDIEPMGYITIDSARPIDSAFLACDESMEPDIKAGNIILIKNKPAAVKEGDKAIVYDEGGERLLAREVYYRKDGDISEIGLRTYKPDETTWHFFSDNTDDTIASDFKIVGKVVDCITDEDKAQEILDGMERVERD